MNAILKALKATLKGANVWNADYTKCLGLSATASVEECNGFLMDSLELCKGESENNTELLVRFIGRCDDIKTKIDAETLHSFVETILEDTIYHADVLRGIYEFPNLSLDTIKLIMDYEPNHQKDDNGDEVDMPNRGLGYSCKSNLLRHASMTQEYMDTLASERYEEVWQELVSMSNNHQTILKVVKLAGRKEGYYVSSHAVENPCMTEALLEQIAEVSDTACSHVLGCRKVTKALIAKLSLTAKGPAAQVILRAGRTPLDVLERLVELNDDPAVLRCLAWNRSKKVTASLLVKAFCKIPDGDIYDQTQFLKRKEVIAELARLARLSTGFVPTYKPEEEAA